MGLWAMFRARQNRIDGVQSLINSESVSLLPRVREFLGLREGSDGFFYSRAWGKGLTDFLNIQFLLLS